MYSSNMGRKCGAVLQQPPNVRGRCQVIVPFWEGEGGRVGAHGIGHGVYIYILPLT